MTAPAKLYAVELEYDGHRRVMPPRYATRAEARSHLDRFHPRFRARIVPAPVDRRPPSPFAVFDDTVTGSTP